MQKIEGSTRSWGFNSGCFSDNGHVSTNIPMSGGGGIIETTLFKNSNVARTGSTTRTKQKGVKFIIKVL